MRFLIIGELNPDLILQGYRTFPSAGREVLVEDAVLALGSASAICAAGLARLGNRVSFAAKVGRDMWGDFCLEALSNAGVDVSSVIRDPAVKTGLTVSITSSRDRALVTYTGAIAALRASDIEEAVLAGFQHLHISSYYLQEGLRPGCRALFAAAHAHGLSSSLDPGYDPSERWGPDILGTLSEVDVFLPNEVELRAISGCEDPVEALRALSNGRTLTVAKLGAAGCMALEGRQVILTPAFPVQPVDTTGAGDSFNAGFLHAWLRKRPLAEALRFAAACGAISTLGPGGTGHQATEQQAEEMLHESAGN